MSTNLIKLMCLVSCAALGLPWCLAAADLEAVAKPSVKNILFIMSDDLKASVLPAYGNGVCKTPNLDRLAASSMVFERAYC